MKGLLPDLTVCAYYEPCSAQFESSDCKKAGRPAVSELGLGPLEYNIACNFLAAWWEAGPVHENANRLHDHNDAQRWTCERR